MNILRRIHIIALCASVILVQRGECAGNCVLSWENGTVLSDTYWNFGFVLDAMLDTTEPETVLLNMTASAISSISTIVSDSDSGQLFILPVLQDGWFTVTVADIFESYEELETVTQILVTVTFVCTTDTRTLEILQPVTDTNNHYPEFQNAPYVYNLPMPFPSGFSVQLFGTISARDIDLTNTNISFTLNSSDPNSNGFTASWLSQDSVDTKLHYAQLLTTSLLSLNDNVTFDIFATDTGTPPLTSSTTITIAMDEENSALAPKFTSPVYIADLSDYTLEDAEGSVIMFDQGTVRLSQGYDETLVFTVIDNTGSYADHFNLTISDDYAYVTITLRDVTEALLAEKFLVLTLSGTSPDSTEVAYTVLHVTLPGIVCEETTTESISSTDASTTVSDSVTDGVSTPSGTDSSSSSTTTVSDGVTNSSSSATDTDSTATAETTTITECPTITTEECYCDCSSTTDSDATTATYSAATTVSPDNITATTSNINNEDDNTTAVTSNGGSATTVTGDSDDTTATTVTSSGDNVSATTVTGNSDNTTAATVTSSGDNVSATTVTGNSDNTTAATVTSSGNDNSATTVGSNDNDDTTTTATSNNTDETITGSDSSATTDCPVITVTEECICNDTTDITSLWSSTTVESSDDNDATTVTSVTSVTNSEEATTTVVTPSLSFSSTYYVFEKESTFTGVLMTQTATATNVDGTIVYSVNIDDEYLSSRIVMDATTAQLEVTATISPAVYTFEIIATLEEADLTASATVTLVISSITECSGEISFGYALQIIELEEETAHENVIPLADNGCSYTIYSQSPSQDLFTISGTYLNTVAIDREASYFSEMSTPQVRVIIDMSCPNDTDATSSTRLKRDTEYEVLTENIAYLRTRTVVVAIILDINDNAPVWSSNTPSYLGFPGYDLAQLLIVPYIFNFSATDADSGDNAVVTYDLTTGSDLFHIHETEGTLYIQKGAYVDEEQVVTLSASDGTFVTTKDVIVKSLTKDNVVILYINDAVIEDAEDILSELSTTTEYTMRSLGEAVVSESQISSTNVTRSKRSTSRNTLLRLLTYGVDNNVTVSSSILLSSLEVIVPTWDIDGMVSFESISTTTVTEVQSTRGYWVAIIVLSILLILILIVTAATYFLFCRSHAATSTPSKVNYENFDNRNSYGNNGNSFVNSLTLEDSNDGPRESTDSKNPDWIFNQKIISDKSSFDHRIIDPQGKHTDGNVVDTRNVTPRDERSGSTKRKSVAFNNTVEEIEVARL